MAIGGFKFSLLTFQSLVGWGIFNLVISMNLFRFVYIENYQRRSLAPFR
jgi:exosortase/archaeosortase